MEFLKCSPKWTREPKQVQICEDKVVITTERGLTFGHVLIMAFRMIMHRYCR